MLILITGAWKCSGEDIKKIEALGNSVIFHQDERAPLPAEAECVEGVICNGLFLYHSIEKFKSLRYIQLTSAGYDRVPLEYIKEKGIALYNARGVYSVPMAEYALFGVLSLYKRAKTFFENQKTHSWCKNRELSELCGKCVLVVGCGSVGNECAIRFSAMGCRVIGVDSIARDDSRYDVIYPVEKLADIVPCADVIVLTLPYTEKSHHLFGTSLFKEMKKTALLVNISRGGVVNTDALICALKVGDIGGAVLDVFEEEPLSSDSPLWDMENVIITPHNSFVGEGNNGRLSELIVANMKKRGL